MQSVEDRAKAMMPHGLWLQERTRRIVIAMLTEGKPMGAATIPGKTGLWPREVVRGLLALLKHDLVNRGDNGWFIKEGAD